MGSWKTIVVCCAVFCVGCWAYGPINQRERDIRMQEVLGSFEGYVRRAFSDMETKCRQMTKNQAAYDKIEVEITNFISCMNPLLETYMYYQSELPRLITDLSNRSTLQDTIDNICGSFFTTRQCLRPLVHSTLVCLTSTEGKNLNSTWDAVIAGTGYACNNKGAKYIELLETDVKDCVISREVGLAKCGDILNRLMKNDMDELFEINSNTCKVYSDARSCAVSELKQCPNKRPAEIMGQFFGVVLQKLPCGFHFTSSAPTAVISNWMFTLVPFFAALAL